MYYIFDKILISADFLVHSKSEQENTISWLYPLLELPLSEATNLKISKFMMDNNDRNVFFSLSDLNLNENQTHHAFKYEDVSDYSKSLLNKFINKNTLLIGYELSKNTRRILEDLGITYIDMWLSPVRFYEDILFNFHSNKSTLNRKLKKYKLNDEQLYYYANIIKIQMRRGWRRLNSNINENSCLITGQMMFDKSLMKNGEFLSLTDFKEEILEISNKFNTVYFTKHPYSKNSDKELLDFFRNIKNLQISNIPTYQFLSSDNIKNVYSISSSSTDEAKYFGKNASFFYESTRKENAIDILHDYISPHFWSDVLNPIIPTKKTKEFCFLNKKDRIRDMISFYWSYKDIDKNEYIRSLLYQTIESNRNNK